MSEIFISYASEDREKAEALAHALEQKGWEVWWDRRIPFGKDYEQVIEHNLAAAGCVLVLWTKVSAESRWVRSEASNAAARDVLIPVLFESDVKIPLATTLLQAVDLRDWQPDTPHKQFDALVEHIGGMLRTTSPVNPATARLEHYIAAGGKPVDFDRQADHTGVLGSRSTTARNARLRYLGAYILLPGIFALAGAFTLTRWHVPTRVQLEVAVDRVAFAVAGEDAIDVPEQALNFSSLTVQNFDRAAFFPAQLAVQIQTGDGNASYQSVAGNASKPVEVVLSGNPETQPAVTISAATQMPVACGRLEALSMKPGTQVTLQTGTGPGPSFSVRVDGQPLATNILSTKELFLSADNVTTTGISAAKPGAATVGLRMRASEQNPYVQLQGARRFFVVSASASDAATVVLVNRARVSAIELFKQGANGAIESALVAPGTLRYPDHSVPASVALSAGDFVGFRDLQEASLVYVRLGPDQAAMELRLDGIAGRAERSSGGAKQELTLTAFDAVRERTPWLMPFVALVCAVSIALGIYGIYRSWRIES